MRSSYQPHTAEPRSLGAYAVYCQSPRHLEIMGIQIDFRFEVTIVCPLLAVDAEIDYVLKSVNKSFNCIRLAVCLRHLFLDNSSVVLIGPATPSLLMRRFQECL